MAFATAFRSLSYAEPGQFTETYGFGGSQGMVHLEALHLYPQDRPSKSVFLFMHPSTAVHQLPAPRALAARGAHVLCAQNRYYRNDTALIFEKVALDYGAWVRFAKEDLGYEKVIMCGWSAGGALAAFYQSQAEHPTIRETPAGDPVDLVAAGLISCDALIYQAASISRARLLAESLDPSIIDEADPDRRYREFDIYDPQNPRQPPYDADFIAAFRERQILRMRSITARVKNQLAEMKARGGGEVERCFITHRTLADPRFVDPSLDANDRRPQWCYSGKPEAVNSGPVGLGRFSSLRGWLSQWSLNDSRADALDAVGRISIPFLAIENSADDGVPQPHMPMVFDRVASRDKSYHVAKGANHYYAGQPDILDQTIDVELDWLRSRQLIDF